MFSNLAENKVVTLSNTQLPVDDNGDLLLTGEMSVLSDNLGWVIYTNNWGGCPGVDCCNAVGWSGCSTCCFTKPPLSDPCVYTDNHTVVAYRTNDWATFAPLGAVLPPSARHPGVEFR